MKELTLLKELKNAKNDVFLTIYSSNDSLIQVWNGFTPQKEFKQGIDISFDYLKQLKLHKLVINTENHKIVGTDSQLYAISALVDYVKFQKIMHRGTEAYSFIQTIIPSKDIVDSIGVKGFSKKLAENPSINCVTTKIVKDFNTYLESI